MVDVKAFTVVDHYPNNDCVVEHQVSYDDALAEARSLNIPKGKNLYDSALSAAVYII